MVFMGVNTLLPLFRGLYASSPIVQPINTEYYDTMQDSPCYSCTSTFSADLVIHNRFFKITHLTKIISSLLSCNDKSSHSDVDTSKVNWCKVVHLTFTTGEGGDYRPALAKLQRKALSTWLLLYAAVHYYSNKCEEYF